MGNECVNCISCNQGFNPSKSIVPFEGLSSRLCSKCYVKMAMSEDFKEIEDKIQERIMNDHID